MEKELEIAKQIIVEEIKKSSLEVKAIYLFGSRARGDYKEDSDWDLLVIVEGEFTPKEKRVFLGSIYKQLAKLKENFEIIVKKVEEFEKMKKVVGSLSHEVSIEGISL